MIRITLSFFTGIVIALALFWAMQYMISNNQQGFKKTDNLRMTEFIRFKRDSKIQSKDRLVPEKPKPKERPQQPKIQTHSAKVAKTALPEMDMPNLDIPLQNSSFSGSVLTGLQVGTGKIKTNTVPIFKVDPTRPRRGGRVGGWVKVEFTVTKTGTVKDIVVLGSEPGSLFVSNTLKAVRRWKFKPHMIAGEAYEQRAVQTLEFKPSR